MKIFLVVLFLCVAVAARVSPVASSSLWVRGGSDNTSTVTLEAERTNEVGSAELAAGALTETDEGIEAEQIQVEAVEVVEAGRGAVLTTSKPMLTLEAADAMASYAICEAMQREFNDISVVVVDSSGRVLVSKTMLNCPRLIPAIAHAKAGAAIGTHASSRALKAKYVPERAPQLLAMTTIGAATNQPFCAVPGGVLCRDEHGNCIGAIGVSGASADEDEHCAIVGAQTVGLLTEPSSSALG